MPSVQRCARLRDSSERKNGTTLCNSQTSNDRCIERLSVRKAVNECSAHSRSRSANTICSLCFSHPDDPPAVVGLRRNLKFDGFVTASLSHWSFAISFKHSPIDCNPAAEPDGYSTSDGYLHRCGQWNRTTDVSVEREWKSHQRGEFILVYDTADGRVRQWRQIHRGDHKQRRKGGKQCCVTDRELGIFAGDPTVFSCIYRCGREPQFQ